jgi:uncharacterized protein (TIGR02680 family)
MTPPLPHETNGAPSPVLPEAECERWQLIRGGLLNIYRFDYEEFRFEQGRLLLRGNNGTGKSRVLALFLPFLLDGEVSSNRVEPDCDPAKRMEWNLLLGKYPDRLGYTWIEFGRKDEAGETHYLTLGCGLYAVAGKGIAGKWFFITPLRVGRDLFLAKSNQPLSKGRLEAELDGYGQVFSVASDYRRAVDRELFRLGDRYESLLRLLILLRQPKLTRALNEQEISKALGDALPPLPQNVLNEVAEAFRTLDADRRELDDFTAALDSTQDFLSEYRQYVQIAARRRAEGVRKTHSDYEGTQRRIRQAELEYAAANTALQANEVEIARLREDESGADQAVGTLASSPQMREAQALDEARKEVDVRRDEVKRAEADHQLASQTLRERDSEAAIAKEAEAVGRKHLRTLLAACHDKATGMGVAPKHQAAIETCATVESLSSKTIDRAKQSVGRIIAARREAIGHVKQLNDVVDKANQNLTVKMCLFAERDSQLRQAFDEQRRVRQDLDQAAEALLERFSDWASALTELRVTNAEVIVDQLAEWCESGDGEGPLPTVVRGATEDAIARLTTFRTATESRLALAMQKIGGLRDEFNQLEAGYVPPPPPPHTRDLQCRTERAGAPLWALCDFRPEVSEQARAGVEAALEASGLLDAWLTPDGRLLQSDDFDTVLVAGTSPQLPAKQSLAAVLIPSFDLDPHSPAVDATTVAAILLHIGFGPDAGLIRVEDSGRWQLGPLHGTWSKPGAEYIGREAREAHRRHRMDELARLIDEASEVEEAIRHELNQLASRKVVIDQEEAFAPDPAEVRDLHLELGLAASTVSNERTRLTEAEEQVERARQVMNEAAADRERDARDLGLSAWIERLSDVETLLTEYCESVAALWPTLDSAVERWTQSQAAELRSVAARQVVDQRAEALRLVRERLAAAKAKSDALEATQGVVAAEVLAKLAAARAKHGLIRSEIEAASNRRVTLSEQAGGAKANVVNLSETLGQHQTQRAREIEVLNTFVATRLLTTAHADLKQIEAGEWTPTRAVEIAREIEAKLSTVESNDDAWKRNQAEIHQHIEVLKDSLLPHSLSPVARNTDDGLFVVSVPFGGRECTMDEFREALSAEIGNRQMLLNAREREVLENHLIGDVSAQLHDLLHKAEKWVMQMNDELRQRPMSTGMKLRFTWQVIDDGPAGLGDARRRLMGAGGTWSPADRAALGAFLQQRIQDVRLANQMGSWLEHLAEAFDYRKWHFFSVDRHQDGGWKRLTRKTYGTGSGGEKSVALTLPQFAAAAAFYSSADKHAPRLILLDEAFMTVDRDMRKKCMGLLHAFDLDFIMTSELEWGCYPTVPALAIYHLATMEGIDAVGVHRWVWNGRERYQEEQVLPPASAPVQRQLANLAEGNGENNDDLFRE